AIRLPHSRVQNFWIVSIDCEINRAGFVITEKDLAPRLATVLRTKHAAFLIGPSRMAKRGYINDVRICGMDSDARDRLRIRESDRHTDILRTERFVTPVAW